MTYETIPPDETHPVSNRTYKLANLATAIAVTVIGIALVFTGLGYGLWDTDRPGPGFFPFGVGVVLMLLGAIWIWQSATNNLLREGESSTPDRRGWRHMVLAIAAIIFFAMTVELLGFVIAFSAMLLVLFWLVAELRWWRAIIAATVMTAFVWVVFQVLLSVPLPTSSIIFLESWGI